jgi:hypothetical protein
MTMGDRGNAIATRVSRVTREVVEAAIIKGNMGSWAASSVHRPS